MTALFIARGPAFRPGARLASFGNVDVQPLMAQLLGIAAAGRWRGGALPAGSGAVLSEHRIRAYKDG